MYYHWVVATTATVSNVLVSLMIHLVYVTKCSLCPYICYTNICVATSFYTIPTFC